MSDQRILATEEMVGAGHATKSDTLNRLSLVEHNTDGTHKLVSAGKASAGELFNVGLSATVGSKALTFALKGADGNDPSASNPVVISFRDETLTTGTPNIRTVTAALSVVLASGGTLGFTAALAGRLYVWAIDNAGTVELALSRTADIFPEGNLVSTTAIGSGSDSASVMYSTTARSNVACRCIGYIEITTGATAGEWDNAPTKIQIMGPGIRRTGDIVQVVTYQTGAYATGGTAFNSDDTIPQNTEGDEYMSKEFNRTSALNKLIIDIVGVWANNAASLIGVGLFQDSTANALAAIHGWVGNTNYPVNIKLTHTMLAGAEGSTTFKVRAGIEAGQGGAVYFNGQAAARIYGGVSASSIKITEVFA